MVPDSGRGSGLGFDGKNGGRGVSFRQGEIEEPVRHLSRGIACAQNSSCYDGLFFLCLL